MLGCSCTTGSVSPGFLQAPLRWGRISSHHQVGRAFLAVLVGGGLGLGVGQICGRLPYFLLLGKGGEAPTLSLLGSHSQPTNKRVNNPNLAKPKVILCQINSPLFVCVCSKLQDTQFPCTLFNKGEGCLQTMTDPGLSPFIREPFFLIGWIPTSSM